MLKSTLSKSLTASAVKEINPSTLSLATYLAIICSAVIGVPTVVLNVSLPVTFGASLSLTINVKVNSASLPLESLTVYLTS